MRSDDVAVSLDNISPALDMIDRTTHYLGYDDAYCERIRLMGEELVQSCASVLDELQGTVWLDTDGGNMRIHLLLQGSLSNLKKEKLLDISKSGRNEPPKGILKRISAFFEDAFMADVEGYVPALDNVSYFGEPFRPISMTQLYLDDVPVHSDLSSEQDELEGIESSLLKKLADDVTVSTHGAKAELIVTKKLPTKEA